MAKYVVVEDGPDSQTKESFDRVRWKHDRIDELPDGFTLRPRGREGSLYYKENGHVLELGFELAGDQDRSILVGRAGLRQWIAPIREATSAEKQQDLESQAIDWLQKAGLSARFLSPEHDLVRDW
jgi:hypothetical protein